MELKVTHKATAKVQRKIQGIEKRLSWLSRQAAKSNAAKKFGITQEQVDNIASGIDYCAKGVEALHGQMNDAAASSREPSVVALGPGSKGGD